MKKLRICVWTSGNVFFTVILLFLVSLCFQSISRVEGEPYSDSEIQHSQLDSVRQTLQNIIQSFSSDPLTRIGDIETELETQENVLHQIRTEVEELTEFVHASDHTVAKRSLKSTGAVSGSGDTGHSEVPCGHSPHLRGALIVNQVIQTQMCYAMYQLSLESNKTHFTVQSQSTMKEVESKLVSKVEFGGKNKPKSCQSSQKIAFIIPCRFVKYQ